jgi:hypothetical protein
MSDSGRQAFQRCSCCGEWESQCKCAIPEPSPARQSRGFVFTRATVVRLSHGPDKCTLDTGFVPGPVYPFDEPLCLRFDAARGTGVDYIKRTFGLDATVIEESAPHAPFTRGDGKYFIRG